MYMYMQVHVHLYTSVYNIYIVHACTHVHAHGILISVLYTLLTHWKMADAW